MCLFFTCLVFVAAMDLEISSDSRTCTVLPSRGTHLTAGLNSNVSKADSAVKLNGLHSPISVKSRLNLSIEVPSASQVKPSNTKYLQYIVIIWNCWSYVGRTNKQKDVASVFFKKENCGWIECTERDGY